MQTRLSAKDVTCGRFRQEWWTESGGRAVGPQVYTDPNMRVADLNDDDDARNSGIDFGLCFCIHR